MRLGRIAGYTAFGAALIYVLLKAAWIAGSSFGVTDMRGLSRADWVASNLSTAGLGVVGAVVALATVRPGGMRVPVWVIAVPMWVGAGLLAPFIILIPAAAIFEAAGWWSPPATAPDAPEPTLAPWIFVIVYGSFIVLGIGLMIAFPVYARSRFRTAVRGTVEEMPPGATHPAQVHPWLHAPMVDSAPTVPARWCTSSRDRASWLSAYAVNAPLTSPLDTTASGSGRSTVASRI